VRGRFPDVEGAEVNVLTGMRDTAQGPTLVFELGTGAADLWQNFRGGMGPVQRARPPAFDLDGEGRFDSRAFEENIAAFVWNYVAQIG
jgi:hypothetical protein